MLRRKTLAAGALAAGCLLAAQGAAAAPPGDVSAQLRGGTLTVRGGDAADVVGIRARGLAIEVGDDASADRFPLWAVRRIRVETGAGDDRVTLDDGPLALLRSTPVTIDGTDGDDALAIAGNTSEARVSGLPVRLAIQRTEPADTLAIAGRGGVDALDISGLLPGAISARLTD